MGSSSGGHGGIKGSSCIILLIAINIINTIKVTANTPANLSSNLIFIRLMTHVIKIRCSNRFSLSWIIVLLRAGQTKEVSDSSLPFPKAILGFIYRGKTR